MNVNKYGKPPARVMVMKALQKQMTSKEAVYAFGYSLRSLHEAARRLRVSFPSNGMGRPPKYPHVANS